MMYVCSVVISTYICQDPHDHAEKTSPTTKLGTKSIFIAGTSLMLILTYVLRMARSSKPKHHALFNDLELPDVKDELNGLCDEETQSLMNQN